MTDVKVQTTHTTTAVRTFPINELRQMLANTVANQAGLPPPHMPGVQHFDNGCKAVVNIEGSGVDLRATVVISVDHLHVGTAPAPNEDKS